MNGKPRYCVSRLTKRRLLAKYGVMCGDGEGPVFTTYRFYLALRVEALLNGAFADGAFVGRGNNR